MNIINYFIVAIFAAGFAYAVAKKVAYHYVGGFAAGMIAAALFVNGYYLAGAIVAGVWLVLSVGYAVWSTIDQSYKRRFTRPWAVVQKLASYGGDGHDK